MKPFDIKLARGGAQIVTRSGMNVTIGDFDRRVMGPDGRYRYLIVGQTSDGELMLWDHGGSVATTREVHPLDLFLA